MSTSNVDIIINKVTNDLSKYADAGLIDENELYADAVQALKRFGNDICVYQEAFVDVKDGKARLPEQFFSLKLALECEPHAYECNGVEERAMQHTMFYRERITSTDEWSSCDSCCSENKETLVRESIYFNEGSINFYYKNPKVLRLAKNVQKSVCHSTCMNTKFVENPNEITIIGKTIQANYNKGKIYLRYYGLPVDEEGNIDVPDTKNGYLNTYIEYHLKRRIAEVLMGNNDSAGLQNLYQIYAQQESLALRNTSSELKLSKLTPQSMRKMMLRNRLEVLSYEIELPRWL